MSSTSSANRWWHIDDNGSSARTAGRPEGTFVKPKVRSTPSPEIQCVKWQFKVFVSTPLQPNEKVSIAGACDQLGNWIPNHSVFLEKLQGKIVVGLLFNI